jgi:iron complex transport system ATP-binding protein
MATINLDDVTLAYKGFAPIEGLSARIPHGQFTALIGPSGCGKSTLLAGIAGQLKPNRGSIKLSGDDVYELPKGELDKQMALLPQKPNALHELTVRELVERGRAPHRKWYQPWADADEQIVNAAMREAGVGGLGGRTLQELSGGQHQRAWIARTLAQQTDVILVDEPTTFLSVTSQEEVLGLLSRLRHEQGRTIVAVLHDLNHAQRFADFVMAMRDGRIAAMGETREMMQPDVLREVFEIEVSV